MDPIYYHNPNCSKSRKGLEILHTLNTPFKLRNLNTSPLNKDELKNLCDIITDKKRLLCRLTDTELTPYGKDEKQQIINAILDQPKQLQRPILLLNKKAYICRPPEKLNDLLCQ